MIIVYQVWGSLFLLGCTITDLKIKKVYQSVCIVNYTVAVIVRLVLSQMPFKSFVEGIALSGVLLIISVLTKQSIGYGDIWVILALTAILKVQYVVEILVLSLFICCIFSLILLLIKRVNMKSRLPFVPFLLVSNLFLAAMGGGHGI